MPLGISVEFSVVTRDYNKKIKNANLLAIKKMIIAIAGPITNILIICMTILLKQYINENIYEPIIYSNILIAIFNLLPIYPLDGGRFLKSLIHIIKGNIKSIRYINFISNATMIILTMISSIAIYYYKNIAILLIIIYLWTITIIENKKFKIKNRINKIIENS